MLEELAGVIFGPIGAVTAVVLLVAKAVRKPAYSKVRDNKAAVVLTRVEHDSKHIDNNENNDNVNDESGDKYSDFVLAAPSKKPSKRSLTRKSSISQAKEPVATHVSKAKPKNTAKTRKTKSKSKPLSSAKKGKKAA